MKKSISSSTYNLLLEGFKDLEKLFSVYSLKSLINIIDSARFDEDESRNIYYSLSHSYLELLKEYRNLMIDREMDASPREAIKSRQEAIEELTDSVYLLHYKTPNSAPHVKSNEQAISEYRSQISKLETALVIAEKKLKNLELLLDNTSDLLFHIIQLGVADKDSHTRFIADLSLQSCPLASIHLCKFYPKLNFDPDIIHYIISGLGDKKYNLLEPAKEAFKKLLTSLEFKRTVPFKGVTTLADFDPELACYCFELNFAVDIAEDFEEILHTGNLKLIRAALEYNKHCANHDWRLEKKLKEHPNFLVIALQETLKMIWLDIDEDQLIGIVKLLYEYYPKELQTKIGFGKPDRFSDYKDYIDGSLPYLAMRYAKPKFLQFLASMKDVNNELLFQGKDLVDYKRDMMGVRNNFPSYHTTQLCQIIEYIGSNSKPTHISNFYEYYTISEFIENVATPYDPQAIEYLTKLLKYIPYAEENTQTKIKTYLYFYNQLVRNVFDARASTQEIEAYLELISKELESEPGFLTFDKLRKLHDICYYTSSRNPKKSSIMFVNTSGENLYHLAIKVGNFKFAEKVRTKELDYYTTYDGSTVLHILCRNVTTHKTELYSLIKNIDELVLIKDKAGKLALEYLLPHLKTNLFARNLAKQIILGTFSEDHTTYEKLYGQFHKQHLVELYNEVIQENLWSFLDLIKTVGDFDRSAKFYKYLGNVVKSSYIDYTLKVTTKKLDIFELVKSKGFLLKTTRTYIDMSTIENIRRVIKEVITGYIAANISKIEANPKLSLEIGSFLIEHGRSVDFHSLIKQVKNIEQHFKVFSKELQKLINEQDFDEEELSPYRNLLTILAQRLGKLTINAQTLLNYNNDFFSFLLNLELFQIDETEKITLDNNIESTLLHAFIKHDVKSNSHKRFQDFLDYLNKKYAYTDSQAYKKHLISLFEQEDLAGKSPVFLAFSNSHPGYLEMLKLGAQLKLSLSEHEFGNQGVYIAYRDNPDKVTIDFENATPTAKNNFSKYIIDRCNDKLIGQLLDSLNEKDHLIFELEDIAGYVTRTQDRNLLPKFRQYLTGYVKNPKIDKNKFLELFVSCRIMGTPSYIIESFKANPKAEISFNGCHDFHLNDDSALFYIPLLNSTDIPEEARSKILMRIIESNVATREGGLKSIFLLQLNKQIPFTIYYDTSHKHLFDEFVDLNINFEQEYPNKLLQLKRLQKTISTKLFDETIKELKNGLLDKDKQGPRKDLYSASLARILTMSDHFFDEKIKDFCKLLLEVTNLYHNPGSVITDSHWEEVDCDVKLDILIAQLHHENKFNFKPFVYVLNPYRYVLDIIIRLNDKALMNEWATLIRTWANLIRYSGLEPEFADYLKEVLIKNKYDELEFLLKHKLLDLELCFNVIIEANKTVPAIRFIFGVAKQANIELDFSNLDNYSNNYADFRLLDHALNRGYSEDLEPALEQILKHFVMAKRTNNSPCVYVSKLIRNLKKIPETENDNLNYLISQLNDQIGQMIDEIIENKKGAETSLELVILYGDPTRLEAYAKMSKATNARTGSIEQDRATMNSPLLLRAIELEIYSAKDVGVYVDNLLEKYSEPYQNLDYLKEFLVKLDKSLQKANPQIPVKLYLNKLGGLYNPITEAALALIKFVLNDLKSFKPALSFETIMKMIYTKKTNFKIIEILIELYGKELYQAQIGHYSELQYFLRAANDQSHNDEFFAIFTGMEAANLMPHLIGYATTKPLLLEYFNKAIYTDNKPLLEHLIKNYSIEILALCQKPLDLQNPLYEALYYNRKDVLRFFQEHGFDIYSLSPDYRQKCFLTGGDARMMINIIEFELYDFNESFDDSAIGIAQNKHALELCAKTFPELLGKAMYCFKKSGHRMGKELFDKLVYKGSPVWGLQESDYVSPSHIVSQPAEWLLKELYASKLEAENEK